MTGWPLTRLSSSCAVASTKQAYMNFKPFRSRRCIIAEVWSTCGPDQDSQILFLNWKENTISQMFMWRRGIFDRHTRQMSDRDRVNDPPFFAFNQDAATEILTSTGSDVNNYKSAMQVGMPFRCMQSFNDGMRA